MKEIKDHIVSSDTNYFYKSAYYVERKCPNCGQLYKRFDHEIDYIVNVIHKQVVVCSWNCKCQYMRAHEKENMRYEEKKEKARKKAKDKAYERQKAKNIKKYYEKKKQKEATK